MPVKIFHTADVHIGMAFNRYSEPLKSALKKARIDVVAKMVAEANRQQCNLFIVAGDLFDSIKSEKKTINAVTTALEEFRGECVLVMPGNHDFDNGMIDLWQGFIKNASDKILFINEEHPYSLADYHLNAVVYPAACHDKHSEENNIGWIKQEQLDTKLINIGVAHGALEGLSPDMDKNYFGMGIQELNGIPMDLWLLGHTHITYPKNSPVTGEKIFNPGTPEPDGLDCKHGGIAWVISVDDNKTVKAQTAETGTYRFLDKDFIIRERKDLESVQRFFEKEGDNRLIARIKLSGKVDEDVFNDRLEVRAAIEKNVADLFFEDSGMVIKISKEKISKEFTDGSFPQKFLSLLLHDEEALQMAYEMVAEARK